MDCNAVVDRIDWLFWIVYWQLGFAGSIGWMGFSRRTMATGARIGCSRFCGAVLAVAHEAECLLPSSVPSWSCSTTGQRALKSLESPRAVVTMAAVDTWVAIDHHCRSHFGQSKVECG